MVTLDASNICEYGDQDVQGLTLTLDVYYIPSTQNAVAIDSFIYHGRYLYLLHLSSLFLMMSGSSPARIHGVQNYKH